MDTSAEDTFLKLTTEQRFANIRNRAISDSKINVRVTDIRKKTGEGTPASRFTLQTNPYNDLAGATEAIKREAGRIRIISIYSDRTVAPLSVTRELLQNIFFTYNVDASFVDIVSTLGRQPHVSEMGNNYFFAKSKGIGPSREECVAYQLRYVEENKRGGEIEWSVRHMGVYHSHSVSTDFFLFLHCIRDPSMDKRLIGSNENQLNALVRSPMLLHESIFDEYEMNWSPYLYQIGDAFENENDLVMTLDPQFANATSTFTRVQKLRHLADKLLYTRAMCSGNSQLISELRKRGAEQRLDSMERPDRTLRIVQSADTLLGRIRNTIDIAGYTLTLHHQLEAVEINKQLRDVTAQMEQATTRLKNLTEETVDDSATVKIITFLSAVYIPGSFVGTLFGSNFFRFNDSTGGIAVTHDFWIFVVAWVPLTILTAAIYLFIIWLAAQHTGKAPRWPWRFKPKPTLQMTATNRLSTISYTNIKSAKSMD